MNCFAFPSLLRERFSLSLSSQRSAQINHSSCAYSSSSQSNSCVHSYKARVKLREFGAKSPNLYVEEEEMSSEALSDPDTKPRLKWTQQLHQRFVEAVSQLGGADKATPKSVMRVMGIPGITLYHLKSHLQKYRLAKNRDHKLNHKCEDAKPASYVPMEKAASCVHQSIIEPDLHDSRLMLHLQMEVQRKLHEQIEVQRHLQLRIEAQGKYLQSVMRKAQETLSNYSLSTEFSEPVSAVESTNWFSRDSSAALKEILNAADCSADSCLTFSELKNGEQQLNIEASDCSNNNCNAQSDEIKMECAADFCVVGQRAACLHQNEQQGGILSDEIDLNR